VRTEVRLRAVRRPHSLDEHSHDSMSIRISPWTMRMEHVQMSMSIVHIHVKKRVDYLRPVKPFQLGACRIAIGRRKCVSSE